MTMIMTSFNVKYPAKYKTLLVWGADFGYTLGHTFEDYDGVKLCYEDGIELVERLLEEEDLFWCELPENPLR